MPTGYSQAPSTTSTTTAPNQQDVATPAECGETPADQKIPGDAAEAQFQGSSLFNVVFQFVGVTDEKNAKASFDLIRSYAQRCASYTERDGETGEQRQYTTSALSFPKLGDETFAMRISGGPSSFNIGIDIVVIRRGGVLTVVGGVGADGPVLEQIARKAAAKL